MSDETTWRDVEGWPYEVSDDGRVRRKGEDQTLKPQETHNGYECVRLCRNGKQKKGRVHRLVLRAFVGPPPEGHEADHINSVRDDNRLENLRWLPREENRSLPGESSPSAKLTVAEVVEIRRLYDTGDYTQRGLADQFGVSRNNVFRTIHGEYWKDAGGPIQ